MLVLVTYDVSTATAEGRRRLRQVAKACVTHGQRVQNSVFECSLDEAQFKEFRHKLLQLIDPSRDSLRFYNLGSKPNHRVEHVGAKATYQADDVLLI